MTPAGLDQAARAILMFAAAEAVRAIVLVGAMAVGVAFLRRARAAARLSAWTVVLYGALALPLLGLVTPAWRWTIPAIERVETSATSTVASSGSITSHAVGARAESAGVPPATPAMLTAPVIVAAVYVGGVSWFALHALLGWFAARRLRRSGRPIADAAVLDELARHAAAAGLATPPLLVESPQIPAPVTASVRQPIVVLPEDWREWPAAQLGAVLVHEVSHVARRDALTQRVALGYRALFWFSPVSWWLHRHVARLAEHASDEAALGAGIEPASYADLLLGFFVRVRGQQAHASWHVAMARRADAEAVRRIERILSWKGGVVMTRSKLFGIGITILMTPLAALAASVRIAPAIVLPAVAPAAIHSPAPAQPLPRLEPIHQATPPPATKPQATPTPTSTAAPTKPAENPTDGSYYWQQPRNPPVDGSYSFSRPNTPPAQDPAPQAPAGSQKADEEFLKGSYGTDTAGLLIPVAVKPQMPRYTAEAMRQKLQGSAEVEIVIAADGTVSKARIKQSLDKVFGLDDAAIESALKWTFTPGMLNGQAVAVHTVLRLEFRLH